MAIITLTGPTAAGKSTVEAALEKLGFGRAISHTTRLPRAGEINGQHYHFVTDKEYDQLKSQGAFVEVIELGSRRYAMSSKALFEAQARARHVAIVVEPHGAGQILEFCQRNGLQTLAVWLDCDPKEQARRWFTRAIEDFKAGKGIEGSIERLGLMLDQETDWREAADNGIVGTSLCDSGTWMYDLQIDETELLTPEAIARQVMVAADALLPPRNTYAPVGAFMPGSLHYR